ncbi:DUF2586 family protein [Sorangium sp. So ce1151]|uniref:DUF2586 family protein n=1 Tax=Sorangium sp. So ce1151 TaxID=3133332 RepID=UPI003F61D781
MNPTVEIEVLDNQLDIRAPQDAMLAVVATSADGPLGVAAPITQTQDLVSTYVEGPLVEACAYAIERFGLTVLPVRTDSSVAGGYGALTTSTAGTSVPTIDNTTEPDDELELVIQFVAGGTVGTTGMTYRVSLDGGRTGLLSTDRTYALGTANNIVVAGTGGARVNFAAGTIPAGFKLSFPTTAPKWNASELAAGLTALRQTKARWTALQVYGDMDATGLSTLDAGLEAMHAAGRERRAVAHVRKPNAGETEAQYLAALTTALGGSSSKRVALCAGYAKVDSSISRRRYRRPPSVPIAALAAAVSEEIDLAELAYGPLPGVAIADGNGNPDEHDEFINPGLDDQRFTTLRSWEGRAGVWVNNPRLFAPVGSDFLYLQYGRIVDIACTVARTELEPILSRPVEVRKDGSGRIDPNVALAIEGQINARLGSALVGLRKATSVSFTLSRTDDVLRTGQIGWQVRVLPLAYIKKLRGKVALVASASAPVTVTG